MDAGCATPRSPPTAHTSAKYNHHDMELTSNDAFSTFRLSRIPVQARTTHTVTRHVVFAGPRGALPGSFTGPMNHAHRNDAPSVGPRRTRLGADTSPQ